MKFNDQHKALLLTLLIAGTVVLSVFSFNLKKHDKNITENYYIIEPEKELTEEDIKVREALESQSNTKAETNKAFNQTQNNKHFAEAYKTIAPPEDYVPIHGNVNNSDALNSFKEKYKNTHNSKLKNQDLSSYSKVNDLLKKHQGEGANTKSTMSYSLVDRTHNYLPTPVYLCETGGKIVINITVNDTGDVIDAYVNSSSTSSNKCLVDHALQYAKNASFSKDISKKTQIGSITFNFIGKG